MELGQNESYIGTSSDTFNEFGNRECLSYSGGQSSMASCPKGIGEAVLAPTASAIANAVYDAVGARIMDLPITPDKLLRALDRM